ncbi:hypothetical protein [Vibrio sp. Vb339]|uniref:hypothetical protein n=1 Tax=Vibrio sp. Vb339 TaxID=1192013 RepID=UPI0015516D0E|nr:hypothetical protein [Vibrio sp. Vb339]
MTNKKKRVIYTPKFAVKAVKLTGRVGVIEAVKYSLYMNTRFEVGVKTGQSTTLGGYFINLVENCVMLIATYQN